MSLATMWTRADVCAGFLVRHKADRARCQSLPYYNDPDEDFHHVGVLLPEKPTWIPNETLIPQDIDK